jgi:hypothetical protein
MPTKPMYVVVDTAAASLEPYPYVFVENDGSVRELHFEERKYLETPFSPFDGGRPYIKEDYESRDGWKSIKGFCPRAKIPDGMRIAGAPDDSLDPNLPNPNLSKAELSKLLQEKGFEITEQTGGTVIAKHVKGK